MALADRIIGAESGGNPYAANPRSSARGAGQFIDATWLDMLAKHRPDLTTGRSREEILALRGDPSLSKAMTDAYASENSKVLSGAGLPVTPGTSYLAHFAGPQGAVNVLKADPSAPAGSVLGEAAVKANPFLANMTVAGLRSWADTKMGGDAPAQPATSAPLNILPDQQAQSAFGALGVPAQKQGNPTNALMQIAMGGFGSLSPEREEPPPPIPQVRHKPIDLSRLRAAFLMRA